MPRLIEQLYYQGLSAVAGFDAVFNALQQSECIAADTPPKQIIALGKAAESMAQGAWSFYHSQIPTLIITKYRHIDEKTQAMANVCWLEAGHPVPDHNSLRSGQKLLDTVTKLAADDDLLFLVSGGASALAEVLVEGMTLTELQNKTDELLAAGMTIEQINRVRQSYSRIKAGKLLQHFSGDRLQVMLISDVRHNDMTVIGSGVGIVDGTNNINCQIVADNSIARHGIAKAAVNQGLMVRCNQESLYQDVLILAKAIATDLNSCAAGVFIYGGEPTIHLPLNSGKGGRNQSLALALAIELNGVNDVEVLVAGTDGTDGPTDAAGAIIDGQTVNNDLQKAKQALESADAYDYLAAKKALLFTGPTGTNVMDLVVAIKH